MSASPRLAEGDVTLVELLERAARAANAAPGRPVLATYVEPLASTPAAPAPHPLEIFERAAAVDDRVYWAHPSTGVSVAGIGAAVTIAPSGEGRFAAASQLWKALLARAICDGPGAPGADRYSDSRDFGRRPMLMGGFRFDPARPPEPEWLGFPDCWLMVPRHCFVTSPAGRWLATSALVRPGAAPSKLADSLERERERLLGTGRAADPAAAWAALASTVRGRGAARARNGAVNGAANGNGTAHASERTDSAPSTHLDSTGDPAASSSREAFLRAVAEGAVAVREGALEKVVAARAVAWRPHDAPDAAAALRRLEERHPECNVFAVVRGRRVFLGASPERLVRVDGRTVRATSLAGSIARGEGEEEDARRAAQLMASAKDREEHDIVVRALTDALGEVCDAVSAPATPGLLTLRDVHHLYTPVTARRHEGTDLFSLLERLHPTPAVGGAPRREALAFIREYEDWDRGWYAAPVGWIDASGDGEFAVALRSALMDGDHATLFAGCGIVADSVPDAEYAESELKLRAMRDALAEDASASGVSAGDDLSGDVLAGEARGVEERRER